MTLAKWLALSESQFNLSITNIKGAGPTAGSDGLWLYSVIHKGARC